MASVARLARPTMILRGSRLALPRPNLAAASLVRPPVLPAARRRQSTSASTLDPAISVAGDVPTQATSWPPGSRRTGVLARKKGMATLWDDQGLQIPVTVLELQDTQVVGHKRPPSDNHFAVQVGCANRHTAYHLRHSERRWFMSNSVPPKHRVVEFTVDGEKALVPIGTLITAAHFVPGQYVDVKGISKGKGFAGVMKRWGFAGGNASHGSTKHHRKAGSTGQHQDPGRVWPGKKMAGRMGSDPIIVRNLLVARIDALNNLVYVKGQVPGPRKGFIRVQDAEAKVRALGAALHKTGTAPTVLPGIAGLPFPCGDAVVAGRLGAGEVTLAKFA